MLFPRYDLDMERGAGDHAAASSTHCGILKNGESTMIEGLQNWNPPVKQTITTGAINSLNGIPYNNYIPYQGTYWHVQTPPTMCCGEVHVFPCPHCDKCKCGAATVKRQKAKS